VPAYERAELSAELTVVASTKAEKPPQEQVAAARAAASETNLARDSGPETIVLAGGREEVLEGVRWVVEAALDAGARSVRAEIEAQGDAERFDEGTS
jgi:uncharacterized protein YqgV (UPF0045/DUF77 family)